MVTAVLSFFEINENMMDVEFYDQIIINRDEWFDGHYVHESEEFFNFRPVYKHKDLDIKLIYNAVKWRDFCTTDTRIFHIYSDHEFIEHMDQLMPKASHWFMNHKNKSKNFQLSSITFHINFILIS